MRHCQLSLQCSRKLGLVATLQQDLSNTTVPLASRRKLLLPSIAHVEFALPDHKQSVVIETKYSAQTGGWVLRLVRGFKGKQSKADIVVLMPQTWSLHREEPEEQIGNGKIAPMPNVLDFPKDQCGSPSRCTRGQDSSESSLEAISPNAVRRPSPTSPSADEVSCSSVTTGKD